MANQLLDAYARQRQLEEFLSPLAARTWPADRAVEEPDAPPRSPLQRDRDRIVHCKAFRRLKHKTQVFLSPQGDHYRTRLTHTLEVTGVARTVARALALNEDLVEAIGLGHDLGHAPFGHVGEEALDRCLRSFDSGFKHYEHSVRLVVELEDPPSTVRELGGKGLNLCANVVDGIACHSGRAPQPRTLEGAVVRIVDRIAYLNHDIDDAMRAGVMKESDLPAEAISVLGRTASKRIDRLVEDLVNNSAEAGKIVQGQEAGLAMDQLRDWMFEHVYLAPEARREHSKINALVSTLFEHRLEQSSANGLSESENVREATDWVAGMTDRYALRAYESLVVPRVHPV